MWDWVRDDEAGGEAEVKRRTALPHDRRARVSPGPENADREISRRGFGPDIRVA
jgi:hypothetical protein